MNPSVILAKMAEEATPELFSTALEMFYACAGEPADGVLCGRRKQEHPVAVVRGRAGVASVICKTWVPRYGATDAIKLVEMTTRLSRHEEKADREFGLDKRGAVEVIPWLVGVDVGAFKRMSLEEQERRLLEAIDAEVVEVEAVEAVEPGVPGEEVDGEA